MPAGTSPTLRLERTILRSGITALACADEAGRGALCGPVSLGMVIVTGTTGPAPRGVRDSKLLSPRRRAELAVLVSDWAPGAVGMSSAQEIDHLGIMAALRLAGQRALAMLPLVPDVILLDGNHDYLTPPAGPPPESGSQTSGHAPRVITRVKADAHCSGVAAASILAKTARDAVMMQLSTAHPEYGWDQNKGYASASHVAALHRLGPTPQHRQSWNLPGLAAPQVVGHGL